MTEKKDKASQDFCGLIMPISEIDGCSEAHWLDVKSILTDAIEYCGLKANLVSNSDEIGIIQKRIIENLYAYPIAVCDVSGKNPNVMFELGIRLTFDKPVIIVKDDRTSYSFDTSPIEHLTYPRDLRFAKIVAFQKALSSKIHNTLRSAANDENYSPFLRAFGDFTVPKVPQKEVSGQEFIMQQLEGINTAISRLSRPSGIYPRSRAKRPASDGDICMGNRNTGRRHELMTALMDLPFVLDTNHYQIDNDDWHVSVDFMPEVKIEDLEKLKKLAPNIRLSEPYKGMN